jgi:hypothetical protein
MSEQLEVDDFLAHYGVPGMKWGKRRARSDDGGSGRSKSGSGGGGAEEAKPKMSRNKKIAIAVGVGATVAIGAAIAISVMNNKKANNMAISQIAANVSTLRGKSKFDMIANAASQNSRQNASAPKQNSSAKGKANLILNAAAANARENASAPNKTLKRKIQEKAFDKAKNVAINKAQKMNYDEAKAIVNAPPKKGGLVDKAKDMAVNKAKDMLFDRAKEQAMDKAKEFAINKAKSMLTPAANIPQKAVVFNPKTGLYEEVEDAGE